MAFVIAVVNFKGGAAKTTTAMALANAASYGGSVAVVDCDPMGGAGDWAAQAAQRGTPLPFTVESLPSADVARIVQRDYASRYAVVVIDGPPPGALQIAQAAVAAADVLVIPSPPDLGDLARIPATRAEAAKRGIPAGVVLTKVRQGITDAESAREGLTGAGIHVFGSTLPLTVSVSRMYGEPISGVLAVYGIALMGEILDLKEAQPNG
jgi:chromosome partitioning protein